MAKSQTDLQAYFLDVIGIPNAYFQPPSGEMIKYPCIIYYLESYTPIFADNKKYNVNTRYSVRLVDRNPNSEYVSKINSMEYSGFDRHYTSDNLHHWVWDIYF